MEIKNKMILLPFLSFCLLFAIGAKAIAQPKEISISEICNSYNGRRMYLELGEQGILQASNIIVPGIANKSSQIKRSPNGTIIIPHQCQLELITCSACIFKVQISQMNFTMNCGNNNNKDNITKCKCVDYLNFSEPPYYEKQLGSQWCGQSNEFISNTRVIVIKYVYETNRRNVFKLIYNSERNRIESSGSTLNTSTHTNNTFNSPFFPNFYPRDLSIEHTFKCDNAEIDNCRLEIVFSDFQISYSSAMEFYDYDNQILGKYTGAVFRPPIIYSSGPSMTVRFYANGDTGLGYRGRVRYLTATERNHTATRYTHCGGSVETFGGVITMMNMVAKDSEPKLYDCIWLIKPPNSYMHLKSHLLLRINTFEKMAGNSSVTLRDGITSDRKILEQYEWPSDNNKKPFQSFVTNLSSGFYISFNGIFDANARFAIVYTTFSYMDCFTGPEFLCDNRRCIPFYLQCDGFDHCGDSSDESTSCATKNVDSNDNNNNQYWYTHTPNYFFPKIDQYPDLRTATIIFFASTMGLLLLIFLLIVILYRMGHHVREQRELQSQLRTISEILDNNSQNQRDDSESLELPPAYEAPPDYDEASSLKMDDQIQRSRRSSLNKRQRRSSRSRIRCTSRADQSSLLFANTLVPDDMLLSDHFLYDNQLLPCNTIECAISERRRHSETQNLTRRRDSQIPLIPESPPPAYTQQKNGINYLQTATTELEYDQKETANIFLASNQIPAITIYQSMSNSPSASPKFVPYPLRAHSSQYTHHTYDFFEQQVSIDNLQRQPFNLHHAQDTAYRQRFNLNAVAWFRNLNFGRNINQSNEQQWCKLNLIRSSSENALLMLTTTRDQRMKEPTRIRRSLSSGILFLN